MTRVLLAGLTGNIVDDQYAISAGTGQSLPVTGTGAGAFGAIAAETARATAAEALLAPKASPVLTGSPTAPTQTQGDASTKLSTTAYTDTAKAAAEAYTDTAKAAAEAYTDTAITALPEVAVAPPTGVAATDDANIAAAVAKLAGGPGIVRFGRGTYMSANQYNFNGSTGVRLRGVGGTGGGAFPGTRWAYTGTASTFIIATNANGFDVFDMQILHNNAGFTGTLVDCSGSSYLLFSRVNMGGWSIRTAARLVSLDNALVATFRDCVFSGCVSAIRGWNTGFSNVVLLDNCAFQNTASIPVTNLGQSWAIRSCTFEGLLTSGGANNGAGALVSSGCDALEVTGCWFGDQNTSGNWVDVGLVGGFIHGNYFSTGAIGVNIGPSSSGCQITGNYFANMPTGISFGTNCSHMQIVPNSWDTVTNPYAYPSLPSGAFIIGGSSGNVHTLHLSQAWARDGMVQKYGNTTGLTSAQIDALFTSAPIDGMIFVDTTNNIYLQRAGGKWYKSAALTLIP
jgi:hypothetical protein